MSDRKGYKKDTGESEVETSLFIQSYVFSWKLENFPDWPNSFKLTSNEFQPANDIVLQATFERCAGKSYLKFIQKGNTLFEIKVRHSILDSTGKVLQDVTTSKFECDEQNIFYSYAVHSEVIIKLSKSTEDQILILKWIMEFSGLVTKNISRHGAKRLTDLLPTLVEDFKSMYVDSLHTDFSLIVENSVLHVHKSVLCARSPVLAKMLKSPMDEKEKDVIKITDIELPNLKSFVKFLYTGTMPEADFESACALYYAADKYDVPCLRKNCADILLEELDVENACRVLSLADRHSDNQLKDLVLDFMQFEFEAILRTESWIDFVGAETKLAVEVMKLRGQKFKKSKN